MDVSFFLFENDFTRSPLYRSLHGAWTDLPPPDGRTHVSFDAVQAGLGCVNSWGARQLPRYRRPDGDYTFDFVIRSVGAGR